MWTTDDIETMKALAGIVPADDIGRRLHHPLQQVQAIAIAFGIDLRCYERRLDWCPTCATWRTMDPDCRVCELRRQLDQLVEDNARAYMRLPQEEKAAHRERDAAREQSVRPKPKMPDLSGLTRYERIKAEEEFDIAIEQAIIAELEAEKDRIKHETFRIRQKLKQEGTTCSRS